METRTLPVLTLASRLQHKDAANELMTVEESGGQLERIHSEESRAEQVIITGGDLVSIDLCILAVI